MNRLKTYITCSLLAFCLLLTRDISPLLAQQQPYVISRKPVTGMFVYDEQLWYIENGSTKILDLNTREDLTEKFKVYTRSFTPIASSEKEIWIISSSNLFVLSKIKTRRFNLPKQLEGLEIGKHETLRNFLPIGQDSLLIRGLANRAGKNKAPKMVKVDAVYTNGKLEEIQPFLPSGSIADYIDAIFKHGKHVYITDSWQIHQKKGKHFVSVDLSSISGTQSLSLGNLANDGSLWLYQSGEGLIHVKNNNAKAYPYGESGAMLKGSKIDFIGVLDNGDVVIASDNEIWFMHKGVYYPFKTDYGFTKIKQLITWKNSVLVSTYESTEMIEVR